MFGHLGGGEELLESGQFGGQGKDSRNVARIYIPLCLILFKTYSNRSQNDISFGDKIK